MPRCKQNHLHLHLDKSRIVLLIKPIFRNPKLFSLRRHVRGSLSALPHWPWQVQVPSFQDSPLLLQQKHQTSLQLLYLQGEEVKKTKVSWVLGWIHSASTHGKVMTSFFFFTPNPRKVESCSRYMPIRQNQSQGWHLLVSFNFILLLIAYVTSKNHFPLDKRGYPQIKPFMAKVLMLQARNYTSSNSCGFYFQNKVWGYPLLSVSNPSSPVQPSVTPHWGSAALSSPPGPPSLTSCSAHPFATEQPGWLSTKVTGHPRSLPQWLSSALE